MSIKTILRTLVIIPVFAVCALLFGNSHELKAQSDNYAANIESCDPSQYTYERVLLGDTWWTFVYDCNGVIIDEYPDN